VIVGLLTDFPALALVIEHLLRLGGKTF